MKPTPCLRRLPPRSLTARTARVLTNGLILVALTGCSLFYRDPTVRIADVRVVGVGLTGGTAEVVLEVNNPNRFALEVREFQYLLEVSEGGDRWTELAAGTSTDRIRLEGRAEESVTLSVPFRLSAVGSAFRVWMSTGTIPYRIEGEIRARGPIARVTLPFRARGNVTP